MATRMLRDWTDSIKIDILNPEEEVFFTRLIMKADDHGCFHAHPRLLKSSLFPLKEIDDYKITSWMDECIKAGLLRKYEHSGKEYLQILDFGQRLRTMKSKFPQPDDVPPSNVSGQPPEVEVEGNTKKEYEEEVEDVVSFLNQITGSSYRSSSKATKSHITARLREKFTVSDLKTVIEAKFAEWGKDSKMKNYLRPETLFGSKFESYLQTQNVKQQPTFKPGGAGKL